jgi:hypothetical protein
VGAFPDGFFTLQECFPTTGEYTQAEKLQSAEELVIELNSRECRADLWGKNSDKFSTGALL